jgi:hypothetical protein
MRDRAVVVSRSRLPDLSFAFADRPSRFAAQITDAEMVRVGINDLRAFAR